MTPILLKIIEGERDQLLLELVERSSLEEEILALANAALSACSSLVEKAELPSKNNSISHDTARNTPSATLNNRRDWQTSFGHYKTSRHSIGDVNYNHKYNINNHTNNLDSNNLNNNHNSNDINNKAKTPIKSPPPIARG